MHWVNRQCKDIVLFLLVFILYSTELTIYDAKLRRVHKVGHLEQLCRGGGSYVLVETLVKLSVI